MRVSTRTLAIVAAVSAVLFVAFVAVLLSFYFTAPMDPLELPTVPRG